MPLPSFTIKEDNKLVQNTVNTKPLNQFTTIQSSVDQNSNGNSVPQSSKQHTKPYLNETELLQIHSKEKWDAMDQFDREPKYNDDESFSEPFKNKLNSSIEEKYFVFEQQNKLKRIYFIVCDANKFDSNWFI